VALRPYDIETTGQINPFDCLRLAIKLGGQSAGIKWAYRIAHSFIETKSDSKNAFFTDTARGYLAGLILLVETTFEVKDRHLGTVRHLIVNGLPTNDENGVPDDDINVAFESLHEMMMTLPAFSGAIAGAAAPFINAASETKGSLQATLQERSKVLDIPSVRYMLSATTRPIGELKSCNDYVLTVEATVSSIRNELNDVIRLITNTVIYAFEDEEKKNGQCLAVYDEFNACGYNSTIETYLPVLRSMGLSAVPAIQDLEGLKASYPKTFLSFIGNSDLTLWLSSPHPHNLAQLSQILGKKTIVETDSDTGKKSYREVDVATPEQLGRFLASDTGNMIATRAGKRALRLRLNPHFKALGVWQYNSDPEHPEALLRRLTRFILSLFVTHSDDVQAPSSNHSSTKTTHQQPPTKENDS
jgi:type IV secretory pathway TraG/TraD family ATPase VirD4